MAMLQKGQKIEHSPLCARFIHGPKMTKKDYLSHTDFLVLRKKTLIQTKTAKVCTTQGIYSVSLSDCDCCLLNFKEL